MLHRISQGLSGDAVIANAIGIGATRRSWNEINAYFTHVCAEQASNTGER
jgi:hypothetical protein